MRIGIWGGDVGGVKPLSEIVDDIVSAEEHGFHSYWLPAISGHDPLIAFSLAGARTNSIEMGTAVIPTYSRHPFTLAQSAASVQAATNGRFVLGIGPSHQRVIEGRLGMSYDKPVGNTRDTVEIVTALTAGGPVEYSNDEWSANGALTHPELSPFPILIAALGPQMLRLAGRSTDGTFTWMTGPVTLGEHIGPTMRASAEKHGRDPDALRVVAGAPVLVCDEGNAASFRERGGEFFGRYGMLPSYRAMLDREGWDTPAQAIITGNEETVRGEIARYADAGVTDFGAVEFADNPELQTRTRTFLASL